MADGDFFAFFQQAVADVFFGGGDVGAILPGLHQ